MIELQDIRTLEDRIKKALQLVHNLKAENAMLKEKLGTYEEKVQSMENLLDELKNGQSAIEEGIINALEQLKEFDKDSFSHHSSEEDSTDHWNQQDEQPGQPESAESQDHHEDTEQHQDVHQEDTHYGESGTDHEEDNSYTHQDSGEYGSEGHSTEESPELGWEHNDPGHNDPVHQDSGHQEEDHQDHGHGEEEHQEDGHQEEDHSQLDIF